MDNNTASLTNLIETFQDLEYFKSDISDYLSNNRFSEVVDDWFWSGKKWPVNEFINVTPNLNKELSLAY